MAVIPMGTANDFATAAGIPDDPWEALQLAVHDTAYPIDVGLVNNKVRVHIIHLSTAYPLGVSVHVMDMITGIPTLCIWDCVPCRRRSC